MNIYDYMITEISKVEEERQFSGTILVHFKANIWVGEFIMHQKIHDLIIYLFG